MARPRRATADAFYDVFADFPLEDQAAALKILEQINRLAIREAGKRTVSAGPSPAAAALAGPTELFIGDRKVESLAELGAEPVRNAALDLEEGPKQ